MNREAWLTDLAEHVRPLFRGITLKPFRLTCGWPSQKALARRQRRIGECHALESSKSGTHEIFVSPIIDVPLEVAGVVCHELSHVAAGIAAGHKAGFVKICRHIGLTKGKPTSAMPGEQLDASLTKIIEKLGAYPHSAVTPQGKLVERVAKSVTVECSICGCLARLSINWLTEAGFPTCGCGGPMELKEENNGGS